MENIEKFKLKKISQEHKDILSLTHSGKIVSQETRDKLALATKNYKKNNPLTSEALANIRAKTIEPIFCVLFAFIRIFLFAARIFFIRIFKPTLIKDLMRQATAPRRAN